MGYIKPERKDSISLKDKPAGTVYEGIYQGFKVVRTELGDSVLHNFMDDEDRPFSLW